MEITKNSALILVDVQGGDMTGHWGPQMQEAEEMNRESIPNIVRVLNVFRRRKLPVIHFKEVHRKEMVDFGRELDGSEGVHLLDSSPYTDYCHLTYPIDGEFPFTKRRYSCFFGTDLEILLKGLKVDTLYLVGGFTDVCVHYTAVDAHQHDYHLKVVTDAVAGSGKDAHDYALRAIRYLQRESLITTADVEGAG
ncbi:MAG: cysteine hydrolase [Lachnospiraceae bacterium]|nr:cysteine hydrolase [Lachnospiraceae bacterium]